MDTPRIAVFGLSEIEIAGISKISEGNCIFDSFAIDTLPESLPDIYCGYIAQAAHLISNLDFFLRHRTQTIAWIQYKTDIKLNEPVFRILKSDDSSERILSGILSLRPENENTGQAKEKLSQREIQVLKEIASGKTNKEIADSLFISVNTVITHRKNISAKLGIRSASGLALYAVMNGHI